MDLTTDQYEAVRTATKHLMPDEAWDEPERSEWITRLFSAVEEAGLVLVPMDSPVTEAEHNQALQQMWDGAPHVLWSVRRRMRQLDALVELKAPMIILSNQRRLVYDALLELIHWTASELALLESKGVDIDEVVVETAGLIHDGEVVELFKREETRSDEG